MSIGDVEVKVECNLDSGLYNGEWLVPAAVILWVKNPRCPVKLIL
jgi:hypothetical protein